ncbi:hypothetical protein D3C78_1927720 [compost metagenome]
MAHIVAIQQIGADAQLMQRLFQCPGHGRFPRTRQASKPQHHALMAVRGFALRTRYRMRVPHDIFVFR